MKLVGSKFVLLDLHKNREWAAAFGAYQCSKVHQHTRRFAHTDVDLAGPLIPF